MVKISGFSQRLESHWFYLDNYLKTLTPLPKFSDWDDKEEHSRTDYKRGLVGIMEHSVS